MIALIRSELLKLTSTRTSWVMPLAQLLLGGLFAGITGAFLLWGSMPTAAGGTLSPAEVMDSVALSRMVYTGGIQLGYLLALVLGILAIGAEFRHRTLTSTFLATPRRGRVLAAKVVALMLMLVLNAVAHLVGAVAAGAALMTVKGLPVVPDAADLAWTLLRAILVLVVWGLMGLGLGTILTNQVVALFVGVAVAWIVEPLLAFGLTFVDGGAKAARFFPSQATTSALDVFAGTDAATAQQLGGAPDPLSWWVALLVLAGYAAALLLVGWVRLARRDVD